MKYPMLAILTLCFVTASASCSSNAGQSDGTGGTQAGGKTGAGGTSSAGGSTGSGGRPGTGGESGSGGRSGSGGSTTSTGGQIGSGGTTGAGGAAATGGSSTSATGGNLGRDAGPDGRRGSGGTAAGGSSGAGGAGGAGDGGSASGGGGGTSGIGGAGGTTSGGTGVGSSGCGKTPTLTSGSRTISTGGSNRSFMLRIPPSYDNKHPYPLVFGFHWNGGTMNDVDGGGTSGYTWSYYGLREQADNSTNSKMIFVAPQGNGNGWANSGGQDLTFVDDMLKQIEGDLCVDTTRVFSMGFSYGGGMSYAIACARAKVFRAVAVYAGAQLSGCTGGTDPIAYIGLHSVSDGTCNYSGGESLRNKFVTNNGCTAQNPPKPGAGNGHVCTSYEGCRSGYPVRWCAFDGGGHTPAPVDGETNASGGGDKTWTKAEVWKFFTQF